MAGFDKQTKLLLPPRLARGDTVGIVAPASPFDRDEFRSGLDILKSMGLKVRLPAGLFHKNGFLAGSDHHRADCIHRHFKDPLVKAVVCARGGYGCMRILDVLDFELIRQNPKAFLGFSDITALLTSIYQRTGLVTFHGPVATGLATASEASRQALRRALFSGEKMILQTEFPAVIKSGSAAGTVIGGNLAVLCSLVGTPFAPIFKKRILVLEDTGEAPYRIDRMLTQMKLAGKFNGIAGLVLGKFTECGSTEELHRIFADHFSAMRIPILTGLQVGHARENHTLPIGLPARLDTKEKKLIYESAATC